MLKCFVLLAAEILLVNGFHIHQDMITKQKESGDQTPINPDSPTPTPPITTTTTTQAPVNPADHGFTQVGSKWYKQVNAAMDWATCETECDSMVTPSAQMVTLADVGESNEFDGFAFSRRTKRGGVPLGGAWIGLKQTDQFEYEWVNGDTFTITNPATGEATGFHEITSTTPANLAYALDQNGRDGADCIKIHQSTWYEENCDNEIICYCEAILG